MNFLKELKERAVIHESLLPLLFGEAVDDVDYWYEVDDDMPRLTRDVVLFYFGLTQAYCFAVAQSQNKSLSQVEIPDKIVNPISRMWEVTEDNIFACNGDLFSYFITAADCGDPNVFTSKARELLIKVHNAYEPLTVKGSRGMLNTLSREVFLDFLDALPLLKHTSFHEDGMKFQITLPHATYEIKVSPFISFLSFDNGPIGEPVDYVTANRYILLDVSKGEANNELFFDTMCLDEAGEDMDKRRVSRQVQSNEYLKLLCKTADIKTQWYSVDDCWCDLTFFNKMVDASEAVLLQCCGIHNKDYEGDRNIFDDLIHLFENTDLYPVILERQMIKVSDLNGILFDLFLTEGLFKTVYCLIFNSLGSRSGDDMFELYLDVLTNAYQIPCETVEQYRKLCNAKIDAALEKLSHIATQGLAIYVRRALEIRAEWETFFVLQAAGIKSNNLFADVETILSIDDYYDMIGNDSSPLENDLMQVLRTLCVFYESLLENEVPFNEKKYFDSAERIAPKYDLSKHTLESLFDSFIDVAQKSESLPHIEELLGRRGLGINAVEYLKFCKSQILTTKGNVRAPVAPAPAQGGYDIFISYAHEDYDLVKPIVNRWKKKFGLNIFFDETDIHHGQNWRKIAENAIDNPQCKVVIAFFSENSVCKKAVSEEIEHAHHWREKKYPGNSTKQGMFLIPVNLERQAIKEYLPKMAHTLPDLTKRGFAKKIQGCIEDETVFVNCYGRDEQELDADILQDYHTLADNDAQEQEHIVPSRSSLVLLDPFTYSVANFYAFLKYGNPSSKDAKELDAYFENENGDLSKCIFPIVTSVKEARIKRDNIAIVGYELISGKGRGKARPSHHILTSRTLEILDYYCIPKYRNSGTLKNWMVEPLLIRCDRFIEILSKSKENEYD